MAQNNQAKFLIALSGEIQAVEDALKQLFTGYWIEYAVGSQLDALGKLVGQKRQGFIDDDYRRLIRAKISVNRSKGRIEDLIKVSDLVLDDEDVRPEIDNQGIATVVVRLRDAAVPEETAELLLGFLKKTVSGGVRVILEWSSDPVEDWFIWGESNWGEKNWTWGSD